MTHHNREKRPANMTTRTMTLSELITEAKACQWEKSKGPKRPDAEQGGKPIGAPKSDPTADAALDPVRLALRSSIRRAETALRYGGTEARQAAADELATALNRWAGH